jgi:HSP20 family protein
MATDRWDPVLDLMQLKERVDDLFRDVLGRSGTLPEAQQPGIWHPSVDVWEQEGRYHLRVDLPGVQAADVTIEVDGGALRIHGERRPEASVPRDAYIRAERPDGRFALSIALPPSVDPGDIEARQKDGVLEVVLRRSSERPGARRRVDVKVS